MVSRFLQEEHPKGLELPSKLTIYILLLQNKRKWDFVVEEFVLVREERKYVKKKPLL